MSFFAASTSKSNPASSLKWNFVIRGGGLSGRASTWSWLTVLILLASRIKILIDDSVDLRPACAARLSSVR